MTIEYQQALKEIYIILGFMEDKYIEKLPNKLIRFIKENMDLSYEDNINESIPIDKQSLKKDTKILLSLMYRNYWCDEDTKKKLMQEDMQYKRKYEQELYEKYNPEGLFKNKNKVIKINEDEKQLILTKGSFFKKIINKIKSFFKDKEILWKN